MLEFQLFRDEHGADLQVARRAFGQVFGRRGMTKFSKWKVPPTGGSSAPYQSSLPPLAGSLLAPLRCGHGALETCFDPLADHHRCRLLSRHNGGRRLGSQRVRARGKSHGTTVQGTGAFGTYSCDVARGHQGAVETLWRLVA